MSLNSLRSNSNANDMIHSNRIDEMAASSEHARFLVEKISKLKNEADIMTLVSGKDHQRVEIHRVILAAMSDYFERNLGNSFDDVEIVLDGVDGKFLREIILFSYTGLLKLNEDNVKELLDFALKYEFKLLHEKCIRFCVQQLQLSKTNCVKWFAFANEQNMNALRYGAFQMICANFERISSRDICELNFENFKEIIESGENMAREEIIFDQLVKWIQFDEIGRSQYASTLIQCIRLHHIREKALIEKVMVFGQKHNIAGLIDNEYKDRLQNPKRLYESRYAHTRSVFEIHERGPTVVIRTYDGLWNCWRKVITITNELPQKYYGTAFCMGKLFIIGGCTETGKFLKDVDVFDFETKTCSDLSEMKVERGFFNPLVVDQFIYVFGGHNGLPLKDCERYNMKSEKWETLKSMSYGHHSLSVASVNGYIFVADGNYQNKGCCCIVERYDPCKDMWMKVASVLNPMFEGVLVEWKGFLYAVDVNTEGMQRYDCEQNTWVRPIVLDGEDEILSSFRKLRLINFDYSREQVIVREKDFFTRLCAPNSNVVIQNFA